MEYEWAHCLMPSGKPCGAKDEWYWPLEQRCELKQLHSTRVKDRRRTQLCGEGRWEWSGGLRCAIRSTRCSISAGTDHRGRLSTRGLRAWRGGGLANCFSSAVLWCCCPIVRYHAERRGSLALVCSRRCARRARRAGRLSGRHLCHCTCREV